MAVTHSSAGYTGTVDQVDEARRFAYGAGGTFRVVAATDWAISASGSSQRTINIAAGMASACGVVDITTQADSLVVAANSSGADRYDAIVATFNWANGTTSFRVVQGTSSAPAIVNSGTAVNQAKINWLPGLQYDAVLAIVWVRPNVGIIAPTDVYDLRVWGPWDRMSISLLGSEGGAGVPSRWLSMIDVQSGRVRDIGGNGWTWEKPPNSAPGTAWKAESIDNRGPAYSAGSAFIPATGWSLGPDTSFVRKIGNGLAVASCAMTRTGAAIVAGSTGNLSNTTIATVVPGYAPLHVTALSAGAGGPMVSGYFSTNGSIVLAATVPNVTIATGTEISFLTNAYPLA